MEEMSNMVDLWRKRLAHLNHRGVHYFTINSWAIGLPILLFLQTICEGSQLGKQHKEKTPRSSNSCSNAILDLIHFYVCGPLWVPSFGGKKYFVTFINEFNHSIWVFFLQQKSEVFFGFHEIQICS
jgi:hypothetical protein